LIQLFFYVGNLRNGNVALSKTAINLKSVTSQISIFLNLTGKNKKVYNSLSHTLYNTELLQLDVQFYSGLQTLCHYYHHVQSGTRGICTF